MKPTPFPGCLFILILFLSFSSFAQNDAGNITPTYIYSVYMNPEPQGFAPAVISSAEASGESANARASAGFDKVFFSKQALANILVVEGCVGIRFYNAIQEEGTLIAVGIKSDGSELNNKNSRLTLSNGLSANPAEEEIRRTVAITCVTNLHNSGKHKNFTAYFSKSDIEEMIYRMNATGIFLQPGLRKFRDYSGSVLDLVTLNACATELKDGQNVEWGGSEAQYKKSLHPCPYICGEASNYLIPMGN